MEFTETYLEHDNEASTSNQGYDTENQPTEIVDQRYGEKLQYDPAGPFEKNRYRTDFCWLVGFVFFLVVWLIVIIYAFSAGSVGKWQGPTDSQGRVCGYDVEVYERPYLLHYNKDSCFMCFVCVSECPKYTFNYLAHNAKVPRIIPNEVVIPEELPPSLSSSTTSSTEATTLQTVETSSQSTTASMAETISSSTESTSTSTTTSKPNDEASPARSKREVMIDDPRLKQNMTLEEIKKYMICRADVKFDDVIRWDQLDYLVTVGMCAKKYDESNYIVENHCSSLNVSREGWRHTLPRVSRDISNAKFSIIGFILLSALITLMSISLMRWYAPAFVCVSIFIMCAAIFYGIYDACLNGAESKTKGVLLALFLCVLVLVLVSLVCIYFRKQIFLACQMIRESSKAVMCILSSLAFSFVCFVVYLLILILGVSVYFSLTTIETPDFRVYFAGNTSENNVLTNIETCICNPDTAYSNNSICEPETFEEECKTDEGRKCVLSGCYLRGMRSKSAGFLHFINFLGLWWSYGFVIGFGDMVLISAFATWYWTFNKKILSYLTIIEGFWRVSTYHLGTIALGALLIAVCAVVRAILKSLYKSLNKFNKPFTALIIMNLKCCFDLLESFLDFISRRAYIACAIHGTDFIQSARTTYYLVKRNVSRVVVVYEITHWMFLLLTFIIGYITTKIAQGYYESRSEDIYFSSVPVALVCVGAFLVTYLLLRVLQVAVDTIFHCFLEDNERNDGTNERPYFMSDELIKLLQKK